MPKVSHPRRKVLSFVDSTTHRLIPSFGGRTFVLKEGKFQVPVRVKIETLQNAGVIKPSTLKKIGNRFELTIPVQRGKASVFSTPVEIEFMGKRYMLSAATGVASGIMGSQRVSLSLYSENGE